jgi:hypothetical protein
MRLDCKIRYMGRYRLRQSGLNAGRQMPSCLTSAIWQIICRCGLMYTYHFTVISSLNELENLVLLEGHSAGQGSMLRGYS